MSANNRRQCPRCLRPHRDERTAAIAAAKELYGKVTAEEYAAAIKAADNIPAVPDETLREDYEIWTNDTGKFTVSYGCYCESCGFAFNYNKEVNVLEEGAESP